MSDDEGYVVVESYLEISRINSGGPEWSRA